MEKVPESPTNDDVHQSQSRQQAVFIQSPATTPVHGPKGNTLRITQAQKQALIDNLQLEVTERARKLRAQYALQAQSLRTRIELRINRIPTSLRKANMGELFMKYQEMNQQEQRAESAGRDAPVPTKQPPSEKDPVPAPIQSVKSISPIRPKRVKRKSSEMDCSGKENASDPNHLLPNPKKRKKVTAGEASHQAPNPSTVLSPKSSNSRTLPQSPLRSILDPPQKGNIPHAASPLKTMLPPKMAVVAKSAAVAATQNAVSVVVANTKTTRAKTSTLGRKASNPQAPKPASKPVATRPKRGVNNVPTEIRSVSNTSNTSGTSTGTTIMKKRGKAAGSSVPSVNKNKVVKTSARPVAKKTATPVEAPPPGRRVLRKRT